MASLMRDIRYALRQLARAPALPRSPILTLGLGIGANTAIFSAVNGLLLRPPGGVADFGALVSIYTSDYSGPPYGNSLAAGRPRFRCRHTGAVGRRQHTPFRLWSLSDAERQPRPPRWCSDRS